MARTEEVRVPDIGDFEAVDVVEVLVSPGDRVKKDDSLISLESEKATMDVPSPMAGTVKEVRVQTGDKVSEGDVILLLEVAEEEPPKRPDHRPPGDGAPASAEPAEEAPKRPSSVSAVEPTEEAPKRPSSASAVAPEAAVAPPKEPPEPPRLGEKIGEEAFRTVHASPAVRRFARELGVDLSNVQGSGRNGRILKDDVQAYVKAALARREAPGAPFALPEMPAIDFSKFGDVERRPLSRIQRISGPNIHRSWLHVPHVTQFDEADITELEEFRKAQAGEAEKQGVKLTFLSFVIKACVPALRKFPAVNSSLDPDGEHLILKKYLHIGFALDTEEGLLVPVIRDVDQKGIFDIARELAELSALGREGKLKLDQMRGASFTISSLGGIGGTAFTPIVNAPEVAILGVSRAVWTPVFRDGEFVPRLLLPLSFSYDHRVIDGAMAVRFTTYLASVLSDLRRILL